MTQSTFFIDFKRKTDDKPDVPVRLIKAQVNTKPTGTIHCMFLEVDGIYIPVEYIELYNFYPPNNAREASGYTGNPWEAKFGCDGISIHKDEYTKCDEGIYMTEPEKIDGKISFEIFWKYEYLDQPRASWLNATGERRYKIVLEGGKGVWSSGDKKGDFTTYTNDEIEKMQGVWPLCDV